MVAYRNPPTRLSGGRKHAWPRRRAQLVACRRRIRIERSSKLAELERQPRVTCPNLVRLSGKSLDPVVQLPRHRTTLAGRDVPCLLRRRLRRRANRPTNACLPISNTQQFCKFCKFPSTDTRDDESGLTLCAVVDSGVIDVWLSGEPHGHATDFFVSQTGYELPSLLPFQMSGTSGSKFHYTLRPDAAPPACLEALVLGLGA